jgi:hypothetical protein
MAHSSYHSGATVTDLAAYRAARRPDPTPNPPATSGLAALLELAAALRAEAARLLADVERAA